jgi:receptor expression-enhancing protein 5/6
MEVIDSVCDRLNLNELERIPQVKEICGKVGVKPAHAGLALSGLIAIFCVLEFGTKWFGFLIGFLYPAYQSFKAIETAGSKDDDKMWLTYWVVFGFLTVFDGLINFVFSFIPFFGILRIGFNIWLFHPKTQGARIIYEKVLRGLLKRYEGKIDSQLNKVGETIEQSKPMLNDVAGAIKKEGIKNLLS